MLVNSPTTKKTAGLVRNRLGLRRWRIDFSFCGNAVNPCGFADSNAMGGQFLPPQCDGQKSTFLAGDGFVQGQRWGGRS